MRPMTSLKWVGALVAFVVLISLGVYVFIIPHIPGEVSLTIGESVFSIDRSIQLRLDSITTEGDDVIMLTATDKGQISPLKFTPVDDIESFGEYQVRLCSALPPDSAEFTVSKGDQVPVCKAARYGI